MSELSRVEMDALNKLLRSWGRGTAQSMRQGAKGTIQARLRNENKMEDGVISGIGFKFPRHGVFYEMGVFGGLTRKEAIAQGKLRPHPWFNPILDQRLPKLDQKLLDNFENFVVNASRIRIKNTDQ